MLVTDIITGRLFVSVDRADMPLGDLCGFAARDNAKRGFLFVSKVLGKHVPVTPSRMEAVHAALASKVESVIGGRSAVVIGMAETAVGLASGVFEHLAGPGRLFMHTTRCSLSSPLAFGFSEEHCHASEHRLYAPKGEKAGRLFSGSDFLVLVDDEISTGKTLRNLAREYAKVNRRLCGVVIVTITNWMGDVDREALAADMPAPVFFADVLDGTFDFVPGAGDVPSLSAVSQFPGGPSPQDGILVPETGRTGVFDVGTTSVSLAVRLFAHCGLGDKVLVLGTGEFLHRPFTLARALEEAGHEVFFQSTTRSPILAGGAIGSMRRFKDNYFEGVDNFVYNLDPARYDDILVCYETTGTPDGHDLVDQLPGCRIVRALRDGGWSVDR